MDQNFNKHKIKNPLAINKKHYNFKIIRLILKIKANFKKTKTTPTQIKKIIA